MKVLSLARNTFREAVRNKILYSVIVFAVIVIGASTIFATVTIGDHIKVIKDFGLFSLSFFGALITIVSGVTLLNKELKQKTIYNILSKPVARWQFIVGKFLGLTLTTSLLVSLMGLGFIGYVWLVEGALDTLLFQGIIFAILELTVIAAVVLLFSSITVTVTLTGIFTLATYIAGRSIEYLNEFIHRSEEYSTPVVFIADLFDAILPDLSAFNVSDQIVYGNTIPTEQLICAASYSFSYSAVLLVLASVIFSKRELK